MILRPYQQQGLNQIRDSLTNNKSVFYQLNTGGGKTPIFSTIASLAAKRGKRVWVNAPRNELVRQASKTLAMCDVQHSFIDANHQESTLFKVHVTSHATLMRRIKAGKIKNFPDILILDEAHLAPDAQVELIEAIEKDYKKRKIENPKLPPPKFIGVSATPESMKRFDYSSLYDGGLILGPTMLDLMELGFLAPCKYYQLKLEGLQDIKANSAGEFDQNSLSDLLAERKVYGDAVKYYKKLADGKPALGFCRSVKDSKRTATEFQNHGYIFEDVNGKMSNSRQKMLFNALRSGDIHGLTTCELAIYGLDIPNIYYGMMLRPTKSLPYYMQMLGRILRPHEGKDCAVMADHVNNRLMHFGQDGSPFQAIDWNFTGEKKFKRKPSPASFKVCDECFFQYEGPVCPECGNKKEIKERKELEVDSEAELIEVKPTKLNDRPPEQKKEFVDRINDIVSNYKKQPQTELEKSVSELLKICEDLKNRPMWVYWKLSDGINFVNVPVLTAIMRQKKYSKGWYFREEGLIKNKLDRGWYGFKKSDRHG